MAEEAGSSTEAVQAKQVALSIRHSEVADADRILAAAVARAHAGAAAAIARLDAIAAEVETAVQDQTVLGIDTPVGARAFHTFLIAKQREIISVVTDARELGHAQTVALESLLGLYRR